MRETGNHSRYIEIEVSDRHIIPKNFRYLGQNEKTGMHRFTNEPNSNGEFKGYCPESGIIFERK